MDVLGCLNKKVAGTSRGKHIGVNEALSEDYIQNNCLFESYIPQA